MEHTSVSINFKRSIKEDETYTAKNGYSRTKYICEQLVGQASKRGIPCTAIRYASIIGDSITGKIPPDYYHTWDLLLACIRVRSFPRFDKNGIPFMGVDTAANISTLIFFSDEHEGGVYNLTTGTFVSEDDIQEVFKEFGVEGEFLPPEEWRDLIFEESRLEEITSRPIMPLVNTYEKIQIHNILTLHPLLATIPNLEIIKLSDKVIRNCPGIEEKIVPAKVLLRRHLQFHFNSLTEKP